MVSISEIRPAQQVSERTRLREKGRTREERDSLELMRELQYLAKKHGRFSEDLFHLYRRVADQQRKLRDKQAEVLRVLKLDSFAPWSVDEIMEDSNLDRKSAAAALDRLVERNLIVACDREGNRLSKRAPAEMYRLVGHQPIRLAA